MVVAAHAVGADHHDGTDRITGRRHQLGGGQLDPGLLRLLLHLLDDSVLDLAPLLRRALGGVPVAVEGGDELAVGVHRPVGACPFRTFRRGGDVAAVVLQFTEEGLPAGIDAFRVCLVPGIQFFEVVGVAAVEERRIGKRGVRVLAGHVICPLGC